MPEAVDDISNQYLAYFIALALVLASIGRFFGVSGECGPLMKSGRINSRPNCAASSSGPSSCGSQDFPSIPHAKEWLCSSNSTMNMKENTHCILVCEDGYAPSKGITNCVSGGFMLTYWSHLNADFTYVDGLSCEVESDFCSYLVASLMVSSASLINEAAASEYNLASFTNHASIIADSYGTTTQSVLSYGAASLYTMVSDSRLSAEHGSMFAKVQLASAASYNSAAAVQTLFAFHQTTTGIGGPSIVIHSGNRISTFDHQQLDYPISWAAGESHDLLVTWETDLAAVDANGDPYPEHTRFVNIYIDTILVKETVTVLAPVSTGSTFTVYFGMGASTVTNYPSGTNYPFSGQMHALRIWSEKLTTGSTADLAYSTMCPTRMDDAAASVAAAANNAALAQRASYSQFPMVDKFADAASAGPILQTPEVAEGDAPPQLDFAEEEEPVAVDSTETADPIPQAH